MQALGCWRSWPILSAKDVIRTARERRATGLEQEHSSRLLFCVLNAGLCREGGEASDWAERPGAQRPRTSAPGVLCGAPSSCVTLGILMWNAPIRRTIRALPSGGGVRHLPPGVDDHVTGTLPGLLASFALN